MGSAHTEVSGGSTVTSIADLPGDWGVRLSEELLFALKEADKKEPDNKRGAKTVKLELIVKNGIIYDRGGWRIGKVD